MPKDEGLMAILGIEGGAKGGSDSHDADARTLKKALDAGNGKRAYSIVKGWVEECLASKEEEPAEDMDEEY